MEQATTTSEAKAIADLAAKPTTIDVHPHLAVDLAPPGWHRSTTNLERYSPQPYRLRGTTTTYDSESFVVAATQQKVEDIDAVVYADEPSLTVVAVLNQQLGGRPGWGDHRVQLQLRRTPEWTAWISAEGLVDQSVFAEFIESRLDDIADPPAAALLDLAQTFTAHTSAQFGQAIRLDSGQVQLNYQERIEARAGSGAIEIPQEFSLAIRPFIGAERCVARARLRYRVSGGALKIGYQLVRPDVVERTVFDNECVKIAEGLAVDHIIRGSTPEVHPT